MAEQGAAGTAGGAGELVVVMGPPAVGKMTVGRALAAASDLRLFHNHHVIEPLAEVLGFDHPSFERLKEAWRRALIEEAAATGTPLVLTLVWPVDVPEDAAIVRRLVAPYADRGLRVSFVELVADLATRLVRNRGADRVAAKPSKADLAWSDAHVRDLERWRTTTDPDRPSLADEVLADHRHLRVDNTGLAPDRVAALVLEWLAGGPPATATIGRTGV